MTRDNLKNIVSKIFSTLNIFSTLCSAKVPSKLDLRSPKVSVMNSQINYMLLCKKTKQFGGSLADLSYKYAMLRKFQRVSPSALLAFFKQKAPKSTYLEFLIFLQQKYGFSFNNDNLMLTRLDVIAHGKAWWELAFEEKGGGEKISNFLQAVLNYHEVEKIYKEKDVSKYEFAQQLLLQMERTNLLKLVENFKKRDPELFFYFRDSGKDLSTFVRYLDEFVAERKAYPVTEAARQQLDISLGIVKIENELVVNPEGSGQPNYQFVDVTATPEVKARILAFIKDMNNKYTVEPILPPKARDVNTFCADANPPSSNLEGDPFAFFGSFTQRASIYILVEYLRNMRFYNTAVKVMFILFRNRKK